MNANMNTDRFLTRVWDKQEKRMMYVNQPYALEFPKNTSDASGVFLDNVKYEYFLGINKHGILFSYNNWENQEVVVNIKFGNRFIPMMCTGYKGDNKKLIYQEDIIKVDGNYNYNGWVRFYEQEDCHIVNYIDINGEHDYILLLVLLGNAGKIEIIGNRWEHPELMEAKKNE